jgi:hypothetical protein
MNKECTWHPVLRWIFFIPAGLVFTTLLQGILRLAHYINGNGEFCGNCLAALAEPIAFLIPAIWILPKYHRPFILLFGIPYSFMEAYFLFLTFSRYGFSDGWRDITIAAIGLASGIWVTTIAFRCSGLGKADAAA